MGSQGASYAFAGLAVLVMTAYSCGIDPAEEKWEGIGGEIYKVSDLFERSADSDEYRLQTNEEKYTGLYGSSLWTPLEGSLQNPFDSWEAEVTKISGEQNAGYGMVLCQQRDAEGVESMLTVMIRVDGYYQIGKVGRKEYSKLAGWKRSNNLREGYGISNRIKVEREGDEFVLIFNGVNTERFEDEKEPVHKYGAQGFLAVISPLERFPSVPVDIRFKEIKR